MTSPRLRRGTLCRPRGAARSLAAPSASGTAALPHLPHRIGLRDAPGALPSPNGRVLPAQPLGWLPRRIELPTAGDRVPLAEGDVGLLEPRTEMHRSRTAVGAGVLRTPLYRLFARVDADFANLRTALTERHP